ncbi:TnsA endonuclease N-terminal domain-containing protein [Vibrio metschnikovii]|uniref:TnsA endonuclease N-terminal domain-containing protein n=1 Tax=Vibrio metschnikovii TaxID=28172 RepID=UPI001C30CEAE|nr:TnsA endonuclease N-terminal domain-containing protein [Vibrio metschnikovii]
MSRGRKLQTEEHFKKALKNGYGLGSYKDYLPWYRVQDVKSDGNRSKIFGFKTRRIHHTMSSIESEFFYIADFSDSVMDIREQFPLLPLNLSQRISSSIGVKHPIHPESKSPIIMTTDFLLTLYKPRIAEPVYQAVAVKPEGKLDKRTAEKLDIERIWWELLGVEFKLFTGNELTRIQSKNIKWATAPFRLNPDSRESNVRTDMILGMLSSGRFLITDLCSDIGRELQISKESALLEIKLLISLKLVLVDMSYPIAESGILIIQDVALSSYGRTANGFN